jgi:hypothetical protein
MNRSKNFDYIEEKINLLSLRIERRGKINLLNLNIQSETFFADLLNLLLNYQLINLNTVKQNVEGIDLVDHENKVIAQVSSTCTKQKVENSLAKKIFEDYKGYRFIFIPISKSAENLRKQSFQNPHGALFLPENDILDTISILNIVLNMSIDKQKQVFDFIKKELGSEADIVKIDSNLAIILNILAAENLSREIDSPEINTFEIDKKIDFNELNTVKDIIDEYKVYYHKLDEKYSEFDKQGANKSLSVFRIFKSQYTKLQSECKTPRELFFSIIDAIIGIIMNSKNYKEIPYEELEMCVHILVVDAFIRCKIFKNPEGYSHVVTR